MPYISGRFDCREKIVISGCRFMSSLLTPVRFAEGAFIDWSLGNIVRMAVCGVEVGGRRKPRREVWRKLIQAGHAWFAWTTALPGDRFELFVRDLVVQVRGGLPHRRDVAIVSRQALRYPLVQGQGIDAVFAICPTERVDWRWWEVDAA